VDITCLVTRNALSVTSSLNTRVTGALVVTEGLGPSQSATDQGKSYSACRVRITIRIGTSHSYTALSMKVLQNFLCESILDIFT
jgi:hypothetical protein